MIHGIRTQIFRNSTLRLQVVTVREDDGGKFVFKAVVSLALIALVFGLLPPVQAQPIVVQPIQVSVDSTIATGQTFGYNISYECSSTSGPCLNAEVVDLLPAELQYVSTAPSSPTGDVANVQVDPNFMDTGRTRVRFQMISPLPAGNAGDLTINVRFPNGSTPNSTQASNTVEAINLGAAPGTYTSPPVTVTATASAQATLTKTLQTSPSNLDMVETYRLRIAVPNSNGVLNLTSIGPVTDTLPPGTVFNGATPVADCEPGCVEGTPATVTWSNPCSVPLGPAQNCDIFVNVSFPSATFPSGTNVTNMFVADVVALGEPPQIVGPGTITHAVTTFDPSPSVSVDISMAGGTPNPPTLSQLFAYEMNVSNTGNVPLDNLVVTATLPVEFQPASVTTGSYSNLADFAVATGVRVLYEKNTAPGSFYEWGSSPNTSTNTTLIGSDGFLPVGEYITRIRWVYGQAQPGMAPITRPTITGVLVNPDNSGGPVAIGDSVQHCAAATAVYTAGPANVSDSDCQSLNISGPFVQFNSAKESVSGTGPFNPGQSVQWRLRVRSASQSSNAVPLEHVVVTDLLPENLIFSSWSYDAEGTGLNEQPVFEQIPNFRGTGRTLLRWRWNPGSGVLSVNQQFSIYVTTSIRNGVQSGPLTNDLLIEHDSPGLSQRCSTPSQSDQLDLDGDGDTGETLCRESETINVSGIAQLISSKTVKACADGGFVATSAGTVGGCPFAYLLRIQNVGTVPMMDFVMIDILPHVGDTGVRDTTPRGSEWTPTLSAPIVAPSGLTVYYSTSGNPCRGEVGGPTTGCEAPNWTTTVPDPISSVRAIKVEFGNRVILPFDFLQFEIPMTTPAGAALGSTAYNSFAYQADRADGLGSLAAEPQRIGLTVTSIDGAVIGDHVFVDTNADGTQNNGETGLNDVPVRLYSTGGDGVPGSADDSPIGVAVTTSGPEGEAGWYRFPGLAPGTYVVCIDRPVAYDIAEGSTFNTATGCSTVVTLSTNEVNTSIDAPLVPNGLASVSGYTWFDRNGDGIQNEPMTDGANGITVRLYSDDGDGIPEPTGDDTLIGATVTGDDREDRPGYYNFERLDPAADYFVQFIQPASASGFTTQNAGPDTTDSDADPATGIALPTFTGAGDAYAADAGFITPTGTLALGDQVWNDTDNDGVFEPQNGENGIDGVRLDLYRDANGDELPQADEFAGSTSSATISGFAGRYRFDNLSPGDYIVAIAPSNFAAGGPLNGLSSSDIVTPDPDNDVDGDNNGYEYVGLILSSPITLQDNGEPTSEDGNNDTNLTLDFGFSAAASPIPMYDFGDAPDSGAGQGPGNYATTRFDGGAVHRIDPLGPFLGACVDADNGFAQNTQATADDATVGTTTSAGVCADDEDGVNFPTSLFVGTTDTYTISIGGTGLCFVSGWIDWNQNGVFGDTSSELILPGVPVPTVAEAVPYSVTVPPDAVAGQTYARFRCGTGIVVSPVGEIAGGEVEDYAITVLRDDSAPTTTASATANGNTYTFGEWTRFDVEVTLSAEDADGIGADQIYYSVNDATCDDPMDSSCNVYTGPFMLTTDGEHTVRFFSVDAATNIEAVNSVIVRIDKTAPTLTLPSDITQDPTGPSGAVIPFVATANDALDPSPELVCTPPSNSLFPIGTTIVTCTATDHAGNQASGTFTVTINGVVDLFGSLRAQIQATKTETSIKNQMLTYTSIAEGFAKAGQSSLSCLQLHSLDLYIRSQVSRRRITQQDANLLYTHTAHIRSVLGCGTST